MPVEQSTTFQPVKALTIVFVALAMVIGFTVLIQQLVLADAVEVKLGDDIFEAGSAENMAMVIARDGEPILFPAPVGERDIRLQHLGDDPSVGWSAFDARRPGTSRSCNLEWQAGGFFRDPCDASVDFDAEGTGLPHYEIEIVNGLLLVDLRGVNSEASE